MHHAPRLHTILGVSVVNGWEVFAKGIAYNIAFSPGDHIQRMSAQNAGTEKKIKILSRIMERLNTRFQI
jgi:hypothetical protein